MLLSLRLLLQFFNGHLMNLNRHIGLLTIRLLLGFIFLMQGYGKVFSIGVDNIYQGGFTNEKYQVLPEFLLYATAYYTSYAELIGGFLLVIGLKRDWALYGLAIVLVVVTFGHGLASPIWDLSHVMPRAVLLIALLLLPKEWDRFSLDHLIAAKKR